MHRALQLFCLIVSMMVPQLAWGQQKDSFWKIPKLNPFKKEKRSPPSFPWGNTKNKPSMSQRITKRPKKIFSKTKDMVTPWKSDRKSSPRLRSNRDTRLGLRSNADRWKPLSRWRDGSSDVNNPTTPQDFIASRRLTP